MCGNRPIFRVNKHKSRSRQVIPSPVSLSIDHPRVPRASCRHGGGTHARMHARSNGDNYVFRGHKRGGTRGTSHRSVEARAAAIRHPTERSSLEWPHCTRDDPGPRATRRELYCVSPEEVGYPYQTERLLMRWCLMGLKHLRDR